MRLPTYRSYRFGLLLLALCTGLGLLTATFVAGTSLAQSTTTEDPTEKTGDLTRAKANGGISADRVIVVYRGALPPLDASGVRVRDRAGARLLRADNSGRRELLRAPAGSAARLAAQLKQRSDVLDAYPDHVMQVNMSANDPLLTQEWGLTRIGASSAWDTTLGQGVSVALLDCGVRVTHPDLAGQVTLERNFTATVSTDDGCNHGTHVAGIIAAVANNGIGGAGVAPAAHLFNAKVLDDSGNGFISDLAPSIEWAADNGARVINMSLGAVTACDVATQQAVDYAWSKGVVLVASAGNTGAGGAQAPANCLNVIGVAATDQNDIIASWSNYGAKVELAAPGVGILSTVNPDLNAGSLYARFSGTSMAAPHAAGIAALLASTTYGSSASTIRDRLFASASIIAGTGTSWTYGRTDASSAVAGGRAAANAPAVAQADQGLNGGWAIDDAGQVNFVHSLSSSLGTIHDAGAGWARIVFRLGRCYPTWTVVGCDGRTALQAYDEVLANIQGHNLRVLGVITAESWAGTPADWTANNAETAGGNGDNPYTQAFAAQAAGVLAQHFAGQVGDWEVWNEPNAWTTTDNQGHFSGSSFLYPSNYAWLLRRSYVAIKSAQPSSRVAFGGLFAHEPFGVQTAVLIGGQIQHVTKRGDMPGARRAPLRGLALTVQPSTTCASTTPAGSDSGASYLCATYSAGLGFANWVPAAYPLDDVGQHLYLGLGTSISSATITTYLQDLRQAYIAYEGSGTSKRTLVTEVGWPTDQVSPQVQSDNLRVAFQTLQATNFVARSFWFSTQDVPEAGLFFGLVDTNGVAKPAYNAYQQYATYQAPPAPTAVPTATPTRTPLPTSASTPLATATSTPTPVATAPPPGSSFVQPLAQPQRLVDTRGSGGPIAAGSSRCFSAVGQGAIPANAAGVILDVTATGYAASGWLTVYPAGQPVPATSTLNFDRAEYAIANNTVMRAGTNGQVCVEVRTVNSVTGGSDVVLDATGYLTSGSLTQMPLLSSPQRLADTRGQGGPIATNTSRCFVVAGLAGIPADAASVILNVTAVGYKTRGWLTAFANGQPVPATSTLNFDTSEYAIANNTFVPVGSGGSVCINVGTENGLAGDANVVLDATGYVSLGGAVHLPMLGSPQRLADTRASGGPIAAKASRCFVVAGRAGIPANALGVLLNVTAVGYGTNGWLTAYPSGQPVPATSTLNFATSEYAIANATLVKLGSGGSVCVNVGTVNSQGSSHVIIDALGYVAP